MVAIGVGGVSPCLSPFGADQFNEDDQKERRMKRSFFNYWGIAISGGSVVALSGKIEQRPRLDNLVSRCARWNEWIDWGVRAALVYVQDRVSWGWGYALPAFGLAMAILLLLCGVPRYRHQLPKGSPLTEVAQVFTAAFRNAKQDIPNDPFLLHDVTKEGQRIVLHTNTLRCARLHPCTPSSHESSNVRMINSAGFWTKLR